MDKICISKNQLLIITIIFIISTIYIILYYNEKNRTFLKKIYKFNKYKYNDKDKDKEKEIIIKEDDNNNDMKINIIRDNLVLKDKLYPPLNRYPITDKINIFNNYTRDSYDTYHLVANLTRNSDNF